MTAPRTITIHARAELEAAAADKPRRFKVSPAYSGGKLPGYVAGLDLAVVIDLATLTTRETVTANLDHQQTQRVGHVDDVQNDGKTLALAGIVSAASAAAIEFVASAANGYPWRASIESSIGRLEEIQTGKTVTANGQTFTGPLYVARNSVLAGVAFLPQAADPHTKVALASKRKTMSDFQTWAAEVVPTLDWSDADAVASLRANFDGRTTPNNADRQAVLPLILASADSAESEHRRLEKIESLCSPPDKGWGDLASQVATIQAAAIAGGIELTELKTELRKLRSEAFMQTFPVAHAPMASGRDTSGKVIEAALCLSAGVQSPEKHFDERTLEAADRHRGMGIQQLLLQAAVARGYQPMGSLGINQANIRQVLAYAMPQIQAQGWSTIDVATIVSNTANKFSREGWDSVDQTILRISLITSVPDFKTRTTVSLIGDTEFEKVGAAGEIPHATLGEVVYTNKADTYARMLAITRQDIINDDTSALSAAPRKLGRGAMLKLNKIGWEAFLSGESTGFFSATHTDAGNTGNSNFNTAVADVTLNGIAATEKLFINQVDANGDPLGIMPAIMLVPPTQKTAALTLMNSQMIIAGTATAAQPSGNIWQGRFRVESSPYMEIATFTGNSTICWYLLAEPSQLPTIEIAALNGRVEPTIENAAADFNVLGLQLRAYSDVGLSLQEFRAAVKSDGGSS